jgi:hypothetical protein
MKAAGLDVLAEPLPAPGAGDHGHLAQASEAFSAIPDVRRHRALWFLRLRR